MVVIMLNEVEGEGNQPLKQVYKAVLRGISTMKKLGEIPA